MQNTPTDGQKGIRTGWFEKHSSGNRVHKLTTGGGETQEADSRGKSRPQHLMARVRPFPATARPLSLSHLCVSASSLRCRSSRHPRKCRDLLGPRGRLTATKQPCTVVKRRREIVKLPREDREGQGPPRLPAAAPGAPGRRGRAAEAFHRGSKAVGCLRPNATAALALETLA